MPIYKGLEYQRQGGDNSLQQRYNTLRGIANSHGETKASLPAELFSAFAKLADFISRPNYAAVGFAEELFKLKGEDPEMNPFQRAWAELRGKGQKEFAADVLEQAGVGEGGRLSGALGEWYTKTWLGQRWDPTLRGAGGLALDILIDPLTWVSSPAKGSVRVLGAGGQVRALNKAGAKVLEDRAEAAWRTIGQAFGYADDVPIEQIMTRAARDEAFERMFPMYARNLSSLRMTRASQIQNEIYKVAGQELVEEGAKELFEKGGLRWRPFHMIDVPVGVDQLAGYLGTKTGTMVRGILEGSEAGSHFVKSFDETVKAVYALGSRVPYLAKKLPAYRQLEATQFLADHAADRTAEVYIRQLFGPHKIRQSLMNNKKENRELWRSFHLAIEAGEEDLLDPDIVRWFTNARSAGIEDPFGLMQKYRKLLDGVGDAEVAINLLDEKQFTKWRGRYTPRSHTASGEMIEMLDREVIQRQSGRMMGAHLGGYSEVRTAPTWAAFERQMVKAGLEENIIYNPAEALLQRLRAHNRNVLRMTFLEDVIAGFGPLANPAVERLRQRLVQAMEKGERDFLASQSARIDQLVDQMSDADIAKALATEERRAIEAGLLPEATIADRAVLKPDEARLQLKQALKRQTASGMTDAERGAVDEILAAFPLTAGSKKSALASLRHQIHEEFYSRPEAYQMARIARDIDVLQPELDNLRNFIRERRSISRYQRAVREDIRTQHASQWSRRKSVVETRLMLEDEHLRVLRPTSQAIRQTLSEMKRRMAPLRKELQGLERGATKRYGPMAEQLLGATPRQYRILAGDLDRQIRNLQDALEPWEAIYEQIRHSMSDFAELGEVSRRSAEGQSMAASIRGMIAKMEALQDEASWFRGRLNDLEDARTSLRSLVKEYKAPTEVTRAKLEVLSKKVQKAEKGLDDLLQRDTVVKKKIEDLRAERALFDKELEKTRAISEWAKKERSAIQDEILAAEELLAGGRAEMRELKAARREEAAKLGPMRTLEEQRAVNLRTFESLRPEVQAHVIYEMLSRVHTFEQLADILEIYGEAFYKVADEDMAKALRALRAEEGPVPLLYAGQPYKLHSFTKGPLKGLEVDLPEGIWEDFKNFEGAWLANPEVKKLLRLWDFVTNSFKLSVTKYFPDFHARNAYSNVAASFIDIGLQALNPATHKQAIDILLGRDGTFRLYNGKRLPYSVIANELEANGIIVNRTKLWELTGTGAAIDPVKAFIEKAAGGKKTTFGSRRQSITSGITEASGVIENEARALHYIALRRRGYTPQDAAMRVNDFLFDYSNLSPFERNVARRIFPFYTWTRKNVERQIKNLYERPGRVATQIKAIGVDRPEDRGPSADALPDYLRGGFLVRLDEKDGVTSFVTNIDLPISNLNVLWAGGIKKTFKEVWGMLNPLLKAPIEIGMDLDNFNGQTISGKQWLGRVGPTLDRNLPKWLKEFFELEKVPLGAGEFAYKANGTKVYLVFKSMFLGRLLSTATSFNEMVEEFGAPSIMRLLTGLQTREFDLSSYQRALLKNRIRRLQDKLQDEGHLVKFEKYYDPTRSGRNRTKSEAPSYKRGSLP